ncbi:MAG TPA: VWA domain-containing protein [Vicinamibacterales bacterium]
MARPYLALAAVCLAGTLVGAQQAQKPPQQERPPVFRAGAHLVRVDAYPSKDGQIVEGLTPNDFEVLEDGKPQSIDALQFIKFGAFTAEEERTDPNSQRDAFALAADPNYRVFVLYLDAYHVNVQGSHSLRAPLVNMLKGMLGPRDLFGMLTPRQTPRDLILGRQALMIDEQLANWTWGVYDDITYREPEEVTLESCGMTALIPLRRLDKVFSDLEGLVTLLGDIREERKNILVFSRGWLLPRSNEALQQGNRYVMPPVGVSNAGKLTLGTGGQGQPNEMACQTELQRLSGIDFQLRFRELLRSARQSNVSFYPVNPTGLEAGVTLGEIQGISERNDRMLELANNTDGLAVINSNNLSPGLKKISNDLSAYYVLSYYTTNTKWDGGIRKITVRLKGTKDTVRARREYRAPTEAEMAGLANARAAAAAPAPAGPTPATALDTLARLRPTAEFLAHGVVSNGSATIVAEIVASAIEVGRWKGGAEVEITVTNAAGETAGSGSGRIESGSRAALMHVPVTGAGPWTAAVRLRAPGDVEQTDRITIAVPGGLLGEPLAFRATPAPASPLRPVAAFQFRRTERIHVDWPVLKPLDRRDARLLGKDGKPLAIPVTVSERDVEGRPVLGLDLILAPLTAGDYVLEVTAGAGGAADTKLLAIRVVR